MKADNGDDLTAPERAAWQALPDGIDAPRALEDATVEMLKWHRVLRPRPSVWRAVPILIAAALAVFVLGMLTGLQLARRQGEPAGDPSMVVQRAGSDYIAALTLINARADLNAPLSVTAEVALTTYQGVTREITRLVGPEMVTAQTVAAVSGFVQQAERASSSGRPIIWF
jgi:hypothetical protein